VIVTCGECSTQFGLDDSKVPARGIRVRCSRCKHAFLVEPPGISQPDRIEQAVEDALSGDGSPAPETTQDLPGGAEPDDGGAEADWEFNHDFGEGEGDFGEGEDDFEDDEDDFGDGEEAEEGGAGRMELAREAIEDQPQPESEDSGVPELADGPVADLRADPTPDLGEDSTSGLDGGLEIDSPPAPETRDTPVFEAPDAEIGIPIDAADEAGARSDSPTASVPLGSIFSIPKKLADAEAAGAAARAAAASLDVDADSPMALRMERTASAAGWLMTIALICTAVYGSFIPRAPQPTAAGSAQVLDGMKAESVEGRWIENAVAGPIFVVSGILRASGRAPVGAPLHLQLVDERGGVLDVPPVPVGPAFAHRALREQDPAILTETHGRASQWLARAPIAGSQGRRFQAVILDLPPAAAAFRLAEAQAASKLP
jgi:predicted Zn finger-like uncharacterized protein